jgi:hypothetical protein
MRRMIACLLMLCFAPLALAGPANANHVAADAKWYIHLDLEAAKQTTLFNEVLTAAKAQIPIDEVVNALKTNIGVNPLTDISGVTVYNNSFEKDVAAIIIYAKIDAALLNQALAQNPDYKETVYGKHMLLGWTDKNDGKAKNGCFYADGVIMMADKIDTLKLAVDVLDGAKPGGSSLVKTPAKGSFINASAELSQSNDPNIAQLLSATDAATACASEIDGKLHIDVHLTAKTAEQAAQIKKMIDGLAAFGQLATRELPAAAALLKEINVSADGTKIMANFQHDSKTLLQTLQTLDQENKAREAKK